MIIIVEKKSKNQLFIKVLSVLSLIIMFSLYYSHMSNKFQEDETTLQEEFVSEKTIKKNSKSINLEKTIYKESVKIVNLLEQKHVQSIKILKNKLFIICDYNTDIEPLIIRYGVSAMIKSSTKNVKIAIDLKKIVENKYES